jgi:DNA-binding PadR family transcriptional regulator
MKIHQSKKVQVKHLKQWREYMGVLKYALLGLLANQNMSGYDLKVEFTQGIKNFWYAGHNQIYPELKKMTEDGLVKYELIKQDEKPDKKVYSLTEKGQNELHTWLTNTLKLPDTMKDEFMLKVYFISSMSPEEAKNQFLEQLAQRQEKLAYLESVTRDLEKKHGDNISTTNPAFGTYLVLTRALERESSYINWLKKGIERLEKE